jgi:hypothetical protein
MPFGAPGTLAKPFELAARNIERLMVAVGSALAEGAAETSPLAAMIRAARERSTCLPGRLGPRLGALRNDRQLRTVIM